MVAMIEVDITDGIGCVRLAHGKVNALDLELCQAIEETMRGLDSGAVRAVVLTGTGKAFSAGVDLNRVAAGGDGYIGAYLPALTGAFRAVFDVGKPVVAAVNGHAIAGGCVLAAACDYRVMVEAGALIGVPELLVGVPFPAAAHEILQCALGPAVTRKLILDGTNYRPPEALALGLADELSTAAALPGRALAVAGRLSAGIPADTFRYTKRQLRGEAARRMDACAEHGEPAVVELWKKGVADGRIKAFMDRTVSSRRDR
jgi:enoyl-CoA hydratase/carnithine racemase